MTRIRSPTDVALDLVAERQQAAKRLPDLKVQQANIEAQRARVTAEAGLALYLAKLFDSNDTEAMVKLITALLVLVLDPLVAPDDRRRGFFRAASDASGLQLPC